MIDIQGEMADHMTNELKDNDNFYLVDYLYQSDPEKLRFELLRTQRLNIHNEIF